MFDIFDLMYCRNKGMVYAEGDFVPWCRQIYVFLHYFNHWLTCTYLSYIHFSWSLSDAWRTLQYVQMAEWYAALYIMDIQMYFVLIHRRYILTPLTDNSISVFLQWSKISFSQHFCIRSGRSLDSFLVHYLQIPISTSQQVQLTYLQSTRNIHSRSISCLAVWYHYSTRKIEESVRKNG